MICVDTDVMIDILRRYAPAVAWLRSRGAEELALPGLVAMELLQDVVIGQSSGALNGSCVPTGCIGRATLIASGHFRIM